MISSLSSLLKDKINARNYIKEIIHGTGLTFIGKVIGTLAGLGTSLIVARYYGTEMVGTLAIINAVFGICMVFSLMGTDVAVLRLVPEFLQKYTVKSVVVLHKKMTAIVIFLSLITSCLLALSSSFICNIILNNAGMHFFILLTAVFIIFKSLSVLNVQIIWGLQKIKIYAFMQSFPLILNFILIVLLTLVFYKENNPLYALFAQIFITSLILFFFVVYLIGKTESSSTKEYSIPLKSITSLSFPMFLTSAIFAVIYLCDTLMLGIYETEREVGIYTIALKLAVLTNFVLISVQSVCAPKFSELYHSGNLEQLKNVAQSSTRIAFWIIMPIFLISVIFGYKILALFGQEFSTGYTALLFLLAGQFVNVAAGAGGILLDMTGHEKVFRNVIMFSGGLNIVLNVLLIPKYHVNGAAVATMISTITWNVLAAWYTRKQLGFSIAYIPWFSKVG